MKIPKELILIIFDNSNEITKLKLLNLNTILSKFIVDKCERMIESNIISHITNFNIIKLFDYQNDIVILNMLFNSNQLLLKINKFSFDFIVPFINDIKDIKILTHLLNIYFHGSELLQFINLINFKLDKTKINLIYCIFDYICKTPNIKRNLNDLLKIACYYNLVYLVEILIIDERCEPSNNNNDCIVTSCTHNYEKIFTILLNHPKVNNINYLECLSIASKYNYTSIIKQLINLNIITNLIIFENIFLKACEFNNYSIIKLLLNKLNYQIIIQSQILPIICEKGYIKIFKIILKHVKSDQVINLEKNLLKIATTNNRLNIIKYLLNLHYKFHLNSDKGIILAIASLKNYLDIVEYIIKNFRKNLKYHKALKLACSNNNINVIKLFIKYKYNISKYAPELLTIACASKHQKIVKLIINHKIFTINK
jgi:hypothetical protein